MKAKKTKKRELSEILTQSKVNLLLNSFNLGHKTSYRNRLLIEFALLTGMKISELTA
ncbi:hypothetical protein [Borreliella bavariensis]|uniref:hypothetical protein n=1 Tax=Borreliella bavariensis TaxID=664662 RepID=UPI001C002F45|nr:hypothetical protein [Borreliella bavariensis]